MKAKSIILAASLTGAAMLIPSSRADSFSRVPQRTLSFAERVAYQYAIEQVYWRHRIWPKERRDAKPPLERIIFQTQLEAKVRDYLRESQALEDYWQHPITAEQLQAEIDRMAAHTKQSEVLRELFAALGNDPFVIAECLARPAVAERLLTSWYAYDQRIHGELRRRAEAELQMHSSVEQVKQTSGKYSEMELVRSDRPGVADDGGTANRITLNSRQWDEAVQKLAPLFVKRIAEGSRTGEACEKIPIGVPSELQEDATAYYATAVIEKGDNRLKLATVTWPKGSLESWLVKTENQVPDAMVARLIAYSVPTISDGAGGCADDTWTDTAIQGDGRYRHMAVWTGTEMIVWGGEVSFNLFSNTGEKYNPSTDSWAATNTINAPSARADHTAVWTGSEMIVWGGDTPGVWFNTGGRYNPVTDTWIATSTADAPHARQNHTAIWTGSEMIVWGGYYQEPPGTDHYLNTGGRYNPNTDTWVATSTINAPDGRDDHTAIWIGTGMIIWGGAIANSQWVNTGGRYNVATDSWAATSTINAPSARALHTAVWIGSEMIIWGGFTFSSETNTGGRYNPSAESWTATSITNAPTRRHDHTAVSTGNEMIVWGGYGCLDPDCLNRGYLNTGARYTPTADAWVATNLTNAPMARERATAVLAGSEMIVWGGFFFDGQYHYLNSGGRYCAQLATPVVQSAVSRKIHGSAGSFDVGLPLTGTPGIECRSGGATNDYAMIVTFSGSVTVNGNPQAQVTLGTGCVGTAGLCNGNVNVNGNTVTVPLTSIANAQTINVRINGVSSASGSDMPATDFTIPMSSLIGDTNGNGSVNASDVSQTKSRLGQFVDVTNFRSDVNANGTINAADVSIVKTYAGTGLP